MLLFVRVLVTWHWDSADLCLSIDMVMGLPCWQLYASRRAGRDTYGSFMMTCWYNLDLFHDFAAKSPDHSMSSMRIWRIHRVEALSTPCENTALKLNPNADPCLIVLSVRRVRAEFQVSFDDLFDGGKEILLCGYFSTTPDGVHSALVSWFHWRGVVEKVPPEGRGGLLCLENGMEDRGWNKHTLLQSLLISNPPQ